jgi:2-methylisocitrate lyase-like PEP mutase family enzyme
VLSEFGQHRTSAGWQAVGMTTSIIDRFRSLHADGIFVMPNPYDIGSARLLAALGFPALASTSSGFAATLGRLDMTVGRDEVLDHVAALTGATDVPLNVDSERCYADDLPGVTETVQLLAEAGAAGCSIEDWNPETNAIDPLDVATARVGAAAAGAASSGLMLTARCENHLHGVNDLDDTIARLRAYVAAGAEVVYAPGLVDVGEISTLVDAVGVPVNVLIFPGGPSVAQLGEAGARRISTGGSLAKIAFGAMVMAAERLRDEGVVDTTEPFLSRKLAADALHD